MAPQDARDVNLGWRHVPVTADADALAMVGGYQNGGFFQVSNIGAPAEELLYDPVGLFNLGEVLRVVAATGVTGLVYAEELKHQQVRVIALYQCAGPRDKRMVDLIVVSDRRHRLDVPLPKCVNKVRNPHQLAVLA